jgi:hypothetical protein
MTDVQTFVLSIDPFWLGALAVALIAHLLFSMWPVARRLGRASLKSETRTILTNVGDHDRLFASDPASGGVERENGVALGQPDYSMPDPQRSVSARVANAGQRLGGAATRQTSSSPAEPCSARMRCYGSRKGSAYAEQFAASFVTWARCQGKDGEWPVDHLLRMAYEFAAESQVEMPVDRNFLRSLKRQPGVIVRQDRRIYGNAGNCLGKTTFYEMSPPLRSPAQPGPGQGGEPVWATNQSE